MEYRSVGDLNDRIVDWAGRLPAGLDLIVGIPRSGLLAANLLSLHLDLPVTDLEGMLEGRILRAGQRYSGRPIDAILRQRARILVVDDSVWSGASLDEAKHRVAAAELPHEIHYGAVFASPEAVREGRIGLFAEVVPGPRVFEWNLMHTPMMARFCVDIDGVLCTDPTADENDDGSRYRRFLREASPRVLPRHEIGWLVTSRLEKYRAQTEDWLGRHGVRYRELVMMDYPDQASRQRARAYTRFKAEAYVGADAELFIESAPHTATELAETTQRPVFCFDTREMLYPGTRARTPPMILHPPHPIELAARWAGRLPLRAVRKSWRMACGGR